MTERDSFNIKSLMEFLKENNIFSDKNMAIISNDNDIIHSFLLLDKTFEYNKLEYNNYVILSFPKSHKSFFISLNKAKGLQFINTLLNINNNDKDTCSLRTDIVKDLGKDRYIITIPEYFYSEISDETFKTFLRILETGYFYSYAIDKQVGEQILSLINSFGGINDQIFLNYTQYCNKVIVPE